MPSYSYTCGCGNEFIKKVPLDKSREPCECSVCGKLASRNYLADMPVLTNSNDSLTKKINNGIEQMKQELAEQKRQLQKER